MPISSQHELGTIDNRRAKNRQKRSEAKPMKTKQSTKLTSFMEDKDANDDRSKDSVRRVP